MLTTSASLLGRLQHADDPKAWERFVHLYSPILYKWAGSLGLQHADALDLVQEVFVVLVKKLPEFSYDSDRGFRGWLYTIARNKCREKERRKTLRVDPHVELDGLGAPPMNGVEQAEFSRHLLERVLPGMSRFFQESTWRAFYAHVVDGQSTAEVAARMGISQSAVLKAKFRVLSRLHRDFADLVPE